MGFKRFHDQPANTAVVRRTVFGTWILPREMKTMVSKITTQFDTLYGYRPYFTTTQPFAYRDTLNMLTWIQALCDNLNIVVEKTNEIGEGLNKVQPDVDKKIADKKVVLKIDLKPALSMEQLDARILRDFTEVKNKQFKNSLDKLLPKKMIDVVIDKSKINPDKHVNEITREERLNLVKLLKNFEVRIDGFRPVDEAIVTAGGINVKEINPKTKRLKNFFALKFINITKIKANSINTNETNIINLKGNKSKRII